MGQKMIRSEQIYSILTDAAEDCTALWGAVWTLTEFIDVSDYQDHSNLNYNQKYELCIPTAKRILLALFEAGLVEFHRGLAWPPSSLTEIDMQPIEVEAIFANMAYWLAPTDATLDYICFNATENGRKLWRQGKEAFMRNWSAPT
jgi:hypothetical protein